MTEIVGPTSRARVALGAAVIVALTAAVYAPALRAGFIWDDDVWLWKDPYIRDAGGLLKYWISPSEKVFDYLPLTSSAFWLEWRLWGMNPAGYHVVNVALHAAGVLVLWAVLRRLSVPGAWLGAVLFAVHPVNVASVAWITELKNTLSLPLYLAALLAYLRFEDRSRRGWYAAALGLFVLALASKASVVILPAVLLGAAWWRRRSVTRRDLARTAPFFAVAAVFAAVTIHFQHTRAIGVDVHGPEDLMQRLGLLGRAAWFYLLKAVWPARLCMVYPRWDVQAATFTSFVPALALLAAAAVVVVYRKSWTRPLAAALGYYLLALAPVLGLVDMSFMLYSFVADHWHYVALPGVCALAAGVGWYWAARAPRPARAVAVVVAALAVTALGWQTFCQASVYRTERDLWADTCLKNPDAWIAQNHLGAECKRDGDLAAARAHYEKAIELNPLFAKAHNNLGNLCQDEGKWDEALRHHRRALAIKGDYANAHNSLAIALDHLGQGDEAEAHYLAALDLESENFRARFNLGLLYARLGRRDEALAQYRRVLEIADEDPQLCRHVAAAMAALPPAGGPMEP